MLANMTTPKENCATAVLRGYGLKLLLKTKQ